MKLTHYTVGNEGSVQEEVKDRDMLRAGSDGLFPVTFFDTIFLIFLSSEEKHLLVNATL